MSAQESAQSAEIDELIRAMSGDEARQVAKAETAHTEPYYLDNPKAVGAPAGSRWGYLPCGCSHDGHGGHIR